MQIMLMRIRNSGVYSHNINNLMCWKACVCITLIKIQRAPLHRKYCRSLCFHSRVVNSVGSNSHFFGRCKSYYLRGWLKWCHEPVGPAVREAAARQAPRQLTVLVVVLHCLFLREINFHMAHQKNPKTKQKKDCRHRENKHTCTHTHTHTHTLRNAFCKPPPPKKRKIKDRKYLFCDAKFSSWTHTLNMKKTNKAR